MLISIRVIKRPRRTRRCDECGRRLDGETIRLYGAAFAGDRPYMLHLHRRCVVSKDVLEKLSFLEGGAND